MTTLSNESFTLIETTAKSTSTFSIKEDNSNAGINFFTEYLIFGRFLSTFSLNQL